MPDRLVDVVIVADPDDPHSDEVQAALDNSGCSTLRFNLTDLRRARFVAEQQYVRIYNGSNSYLLSGYTSVWWRRLGVVDVADLDEEESHLARDEAPHLLIGSMDAIGTRMVDHPIAINRAEIKQSQLGIAWRLGIPVPAHLVTNDPDAARAFANGRRVIAKPVSPGIGIAPFVDEVFNRELENVSSLPTLLQELVDAHADLRVVVVGHESWIWRRPREPETIDWRRTDPSGSAFVQAADRSLGTSACQITEALGLSMSVQDWLETDDGFIFLESNAQGSWIFLSESRDIITSAIADHLKDR